MSKNLANSIVTITGGTGSFGSTMVKKLLQSEAQEIRVFSRDENKQDIMRNSLRDERVRFFLGDVRDFSSVKTAINGSDYVFHAAALKQVPSGEFFPEQVVATNIIGSSNVLTASIECFVKTVVCLSTDKAVYPINAMGMSKALMEKVAFSKARNGKESGTKIAVTRYGNVMMSRGSVIPLFLDQISANRPLTITNPNMTRFLMSLSESVELVEYAFNNSNSGDLFVRKAPAATIATIVEALKEITSKKDIETQIIGTRHGEKEYEALLGSEERVRSVDQGDFFNVPLDTRSLDYQIYFEKGQNSPTKIDAYTSHNTTQLNVEEVVRLIKSLPEYKTYLERRN
jgi:UDP-N-acetylglucosamine 4,6-dehydratase/5-epimerase